MPVCDKRKGMPYDKHSKDWLHVICTQNREMPYSDFVVTFGTGGCFYDNPGDLACFFIHVLARPMPTHRTYTGNVFSRYLNAYR